MSSDEQFFKELVDGYHAEGRFGHRQHVHLTWSTIGRYGPDGALRRIVAFIQHVAAARGVPEKYNETVSRFWVRIVAHAMESSSSQDGFEPFVEQHPALLDKELALRHWSPAALWSDVAKREWVEPDVRPIPFG